MTKYQFSRWQQRYSGVVTHLINSQQGVASDSGWLNLYKHGHFTDLSKEQCKNIFLMILILLYVPNQSSI